MPLNPTCVPFVEITTVSFNETLRILERFGFVREGSDYKGRAVLRQHQVTLFVTSPEAFCHSSIKLKTYISRIALLCDKDEEEFPLFSRSRDMCSPAGVVFHRVGKSQWEHWQKERGFCRSGHSESVLTHIDHVALNLPVTDLDEMGAWLESFLGMVPLRPHEIKGRTTSFLCSPYEGGSFSIVLNTSLCPSSQISTFLDQAKVAAVQHLAFATENIVKAVEMVKEQGVTFIQIPEQYYESLVKENALLKEEVSCFKKASILMDRDQSLPHHQLLQTFTTDLFGPIFFELIERRDRKGFGESNIEALFKAVEAQTASCAKECPPIHKKKALSQ